MLFASRASCHRKLQCRILHAVSHSCSLSSGGTAFTEYTVSSEYHLVAKRGCRLSLWWRFRTDADIRPTNLRTSVLALHTEQR